MRKKLSVLFLFVGFLFIGMQLNAKTVRVLSPDGNTVAVVEVDKTIHYSITQDGVTVLAPSQISMSLSNGEIWGIGSSLKKVKTNNVSQTIPAYFYKINSIQDIYTEAVFSFKESFQLEFRVYDDGVAYRFVSKKSGNYEIEKEQVEYRFVDDAMAIAPYVVKEGPIEKQLFSSFENTYTTAKLSELDKNRLMFLPLSVEAPQGKRITISESDLRNYPGLYMTATARSNALVGFNAPLRDVVEKHMGHNNLQAIAKTRYPFIAKVNGARSFPWRMAIVTRNDVDLANTTMSYKLASPTMIDDVSWIRPGKVAWDWWNDWNLDGVDFKAGINNETYQYYIDFASEYGIEYVILDEGWAVNKVYDLMQVVPEIDVKMLVDYAEARGVGIILWAGYYAFDRDMERVCKHYSQMGVKGFKVDFMDGDDQEMVYFNERTAAMCAKYKLLVDLHGTYKPAGLNRTYPNILNFEGVHGLEQMKWQPQSCDQVTYDVTVPFLRMISGPIDYTQGAMTNAVKSLNTITNEIETQYYPNFSKPMSQGTRCHQLAEYIIFLSPLNMLCDAPTAYERNPVSTEFIASVPTVWDDSYTIDGKLGEYILTMRRNGDDYYIGGLNNWDAREVTINVEELTGKKGTVVLFMDGVNADRSGEDHVMVEFDASETVTIPMAPGGGFVLKL